MSDSCNPMDCSLPGSSIHGILQGRILEWVAISLFRGSSRPRNGTSLSCTAGGIFTNWAIREALLKPFSSLDHWLRLLLFLMQAFKIISTSRHASHEFWHAVFFYYHSVKIFSNLSFNSLTQGYLEMLCLISK